MEQLRNGGWRGFERMTYERSYAEVDERVPCGGTGQEPMAHGTIGANGVMRQGDRGVRRGSVLIKGARADLGNISPQELGAEGERIAVGCLEGIGFTILRRNWKCFAGEVDIVAENEGTHILIEVKTRLVTDRNRDPWPELAVDARKRERYRVMAELYLQELDVPAPVRFDVIAVNIVGDGVVKVKYFEGAFECDR